MDVYLDIDGVLLYDGKPAHGAREFLAYVTERFPTYWLTTHCKGDADVPCLYLKSRGFDIAELIRIKPTNWDVRKTEAIDFSRPFLWFEDKPLASEIADLNLAGRRESLMLIDLKQKPNMLTEIASDFPLVV